jgi:hypothetical protein
MSYIPSIFGASNVQVGYTRAHRPGSAAESLSTRATSSGDREAMVAVRDALADVINALGESSRVLSSARSSIMPRPATVSSSEDTGLSTEGTATTMTSSEEVNSTPTSFSPRGPGWDDSSTSEVTVGGTYDGSRGDGEVQITVRRSYGDKEVGEDWIQIRVREGGDTLKQWYLSPSYEPGTEVDIGAGLTLSFSEGRLNRNADAYFDISSSQDSELDPDAAFNGVRNAHPELEDGYAVTDGSFELNGETIAVNASDSLNDVLDRINASDAGVTAAYDTNTEKITLTQETTGSGPTVVFNNDTSGFLAAMKLDTATAVPGADSEASAVIADVAVLDSVSSGSILVNGESIAIDIDSDSIKDVISRINESDARVTASLSANAQTVTFTNDDGSADLELDSNGTSFFEAVNVASGTYEPYVPRGTTESRAEAVGDAVASFADTLNHLFDRSNNGLTDSTFLSSVRNDVQIALGDVFNEDGSRFRTDYGITFDFREEADQVVSFNWAARARMENMLRTGGRDAEIYDLFLGGNSTAARGIDEQLSQVLQSAQSDMDSVLGPLGNYLDLWL